MIYCSIYPCVQFKSSSSKLPLLPRAIGILKFWFTALIVYCTFHSTVTIYLPLFMQQNEDPQAGPSTPSRKRSRWDIDGSPGSPTEKEQQVAKRRTKSRQPKETRAAADTPTPPPPDRIRSHSHPIQAKRHLHSIYVPPRTSHPPITPSRSVYCYERLNSIEEGSYGVVFRAKDKQTGDIVALKKLKLDEEKQGFPITALREINSLMACKHENVVGIREVVVGETLTQCVEFSFRSREFLLHAHVSVSVYRKYKSLYCDGLH